LLAGTLAGLLAASGALAQGEAGKADKDAPAPKAVPKPPKPQLPEKGEKEIDLTPVELGGRELQTTDGVQLRATFLPGAKGKNTVPVILLHAFKGDRKDYAPLAQYLQKQGHAVLVPDLRGHGESVNTLSGVKLEAGRLSAEQFERMYYQDMETLRDFLVQKNNEEKLNISKLCVVGAEMGALVALNWARCDWSSLTGERPPMHVKALVLISPPRNMPGLDTRLALNNPFVRRELSVLILVGKEKAREYEEAKRLFAIFKRYHPDPPEEEKLQKQDLFSMALPTKLQGTKMLGVRGLNVEQLIGQFIELRLVKQNLPGYEWRKRRLKTEVKE